MAKHHTSIPLSAYSGGAFSGWIQLSWSLVLVLLSAGSVQAQIHDDVNDATTTSPDFNLFDASTVNINNLIRATQQLEEEPRDPEDQEAALDSAIDSYRSRQGGLSIGPDIMNQTETNATSEPSQGDRPINTVDGSKDPEDPDEGEERDPDLDDPEETEAN